jgi:hypothetical protein
MGAVRYSAASSSLRKTRLAHSGSRFTLRYRGGNCSSHARLQKDPTVYLTFASPITRNRQRCMFSPLGAHAPASRIFRINRSVPVLASIASSTGWSG